MERWHCDFKTRGSTGGYRMRHGLGAPVLTVLWLVDPFTAESGATQLLARSHRRDRTEGWGSTWWRDAANLHPEDVVSCVAPAGSAILFYGHSVLHRSGPRTSDARRLTLRLSYRGGRCRVPAKHLGDVVGSA